MFNAGDQVPVIPLFEVVGSAASVAPEQIGATTVNVGVVEFTVTETGVLALSQLLITWVI
ncbi:hypothetical protein HYN48_04590 [Flavobacterium magnum]|uniref:Uncharacterized protein n=1 Tax=Flavobacterium magnum TaxID=2162713 RepID=A0A2S0RE85_9FLAO|nr:hypothetical protein HYN48_04590 [Flavobacterium magnum]